MYEESLVYDAILPVGTKKNREVSIPALNRIIKKVVILVRGLIQENG